MSSLALLKVRLRVRNWADIRDGDGVAFFFLASAVDGAANAIELLTDMGGVCGVRLKCQPHERNVFHLRNDGEDRLVRIGDVVVVDAVPMFLHAEGVAAAQGVSDDVALTPHEHLATILRGADIFGITSAEEILTFLRARQEGEVE